jgi:hypothetical protein
MAKPPIDVQALQDRCRDLSDLIDELWGISAANRALEPDEGDGDAVGMAVCTPTALRRCETRSRGFA